jgi:drug/metabolite transporter (DMT)-like permease
MTSSQPADNGESAAGPAILAAQHLIGIGWILASCFLFSFNDAATKWLTAGYPIGEILLVRGLTSIIVLIAIAAWRGQMNDLYPRDLRFQSFRAVLYLMTTTLMTLSLKLLPLPIVTAINFMSPIFMTALAGPLLGEKVGWRRWLAVFVGFGGVVLIINPGADSWNIAALVPLSCAAVTALRDVTTRKLAIRETTFSILLITGVVAALAGLSVAPLGGWKIPPLHEAGLFLFIGISQLGGQFFLVLAFRITPAVILAPFRYSMIVSSMLLAFVIWGDLPTGMMLVGAAIVVLSGIYIFNRERKKAVDTASDMAGA